MPEWAKDQVLNCSDCGQQFVFTAGEMLFYHDRQLAPPKRCPMCRIKRKQAKGNYLQQEIK